MSDHGNRLRTRIADVIGAYEARTITLVDALDEIEVAIAEEPPPSLDARDLDWITSDADLAIEAGRRG